MERKEKGGMEKKHILLASTITFQQFMFINLQGAFTLKH